MVKTLAIAAIAWPLLLGSVVWHRAVAGDSVFTVLVHAAGSLICHQRPERSFHTAGVQWPVCGRCSGLYLGAPIGALVFWLRRRARRRDLRLVLAAAAIPTAATLSFELLGLLPVGNVARFTSALPLGAAITFALLMVASPVSSARSFGPSSLDALRG